MHRELIATIMPDGNLILEFKELKEKIDKGQSVLQKEIYRRFLLKDFSWLLFIGFSDAEVPLSASLNYWRDFASLFDEKLSQTPDLEELRHNVLINITEEELEKHLLSAPLATSFEYLNKDILLSVWQSLNKSFSNLIRSYKGTVEEFVNTFGSDIHLIGRIFFHLVENKKNDTRPFAFLATYSSKADGRSKHIPLKHALTECAAENEKLLDLLSTVHSAARDSDLIFGLLTTGEIFHPLAWSPQESFQFLKEIPIYEKAGILCRIPNWWKPTSTTLRVDVSIGDEKKSYVGKEALLSYDVNLCFGDMQISEKEARQLLEQSEGLAYIKNKWIAVNPEKLKQTLDAYEKARKMAKDGWLSIQEAMRLQLQPDKFLSTDGGATVTVSHGEWLDSVVQKLTNPSMLDNVKTDKKFKAKLRGYQQRGLNWLYFLHSMQFGPCLADDMGLGKTVQILAFLNVLKSKKENYTSLLVIPASLISNWVNEIKQFFPKLNYFVAHPQYTKECIKPQDKKKLDKLDLVITTYGLTGRYDWLKEYDWGYVILDEAQAIKNSGTKQTKSIKKLKSFNRIILTGTPIENRLSDLWSLFDFLNPGLLGSANEFRDFVKGLAENPKGFTNLRRLVSPYILRRMKSDKTIITDLPDKVEMKTYAALSKKQIVLYQDLTEKIRKTVDNPSIEGIQRRGIILSSLMKFKQLCNHPDQYLGTGVFLEEEAGKFVRLREICEIVYEKRERMLIFTQFKEMTEPLANFLEQIFEHKGLVFHGSTSIRDRKKIIEKFQGDDYVPFMVLSLKAGGVGLNLTKANHVVHFDRWWNPAVERQATDRVFRIGQMKNVIVHKFLTAGTIEEKIDLMIEDKSKLSENVITKTDESWITEMQTDQLLDLFKLTL